MPPRYDFGLCTTVVHTFSGFGFVCELLQGINADSDLSPRQKSSACIPVSSPGHMDTISGHLPPLREVDPSSWCSSLVSAAVSKHSDQGEGRAYLVYMFRSKFTVQESQGRN